MTDHIKVDSIERAWYEANKIISSDYIKDDFLSERAGYPVYVSTLDGCTDRINDLNARLEVISENETRYTNIWIDDYKEEIRKALAQRTKELYS